MSQSNYLFQKSVRSSVPRKLIWTQKNTEPIFGLYYISVKLNFDYLVSKYMSLVLILCARTNSKMYGTS